MWRRSSLRRFRLTSERPLWRILYSRYGAQSRSTVRSKADIAVNVRSLRTFRRRDVVSPESNARQGPHVETVFGGRGIETDSPGLAPDGNCVLSVEQVERGRPDFRDGEAAPGESQAEAHGVLAEQKAGSRARAGVSLATASGAGAAFSFVLAAAIRKLADGSRPHGGAAWSVDGRTRVAPCRLRSSLLPAVGHRRQCRASSRRPRTTWRPGAGHGSAIPLTRSAHALRATRHPDIRATPPRTRSRPKASSSRS